MLVRSSLPRWLWKGSEDPSSGFFYFGGQIFAKRVGKGYSRQEIMIIKYVTRKKVSPRTEGPAFKAYSSTLKSTLRMSQFSSVAQSCPTLCDPVNRSTPGLSVHHQLPEFTQTCVHQVGDAIQPPHPLSSPSPPVPNPSQHWGLFQWVNSSHEVAKVLEFQLQHQSFQWTPRTDLL